MRTIGLTYFDPYDYRYAESIDISSPDRIVRCVAFGFWFFTFNVYWIAKYKPPILRTSVT